MHKILMVEDDAAIRGALGRHLSRWGYQVQAAENFQNILEQFEKFQPHLVLLDISLPFFDGYYWCRQIRRASQTPIIFLSSAGDDMNLVMAIQLGADDFIPKPFRIEVVLAKIQALLAPHLFLWRAAKPCAVCRCLLKSLQREGLAGRRFHRIDPE